MTKYLVEFLASIFFVYVILSTSNALAIGLSLTLIYLLYQIIPNPAVTIVMTAAGKAPAEHLIPTCAAQIFGALVALELFKRYKL